MILIKPDGIKRRLAGLCLTKLENLGLELIAARVIKVPKKLAAKHYEHLKDRPFFEELVAETAEQKVLAFIYEGEDAVNRVRQIVGATNPENAKEGTIRNSFGRVRQGRIENVIHASSSVADAEHEIRLWFCETEVTEKV